MDDFLDVYGLSLNKYGEELCGDKFKVLSTEEATCIVLSDGLGSGVKANILATLTSRIIATMLKENAPLEDVIETVTGTLPTCRSRGIAYATFTIIDFDHSTRAFRITNFDNPPVFYFKTGEITPLEEQKEWIHGKEVKFSSGVLQQGDFLAAISDGVWYAGPGKKYNFGWEWEDIAGYMATILRGKVRAAQTVVEDVIQHTHDLYGHEPGDDATMVGLLLRPRTRALVFTGPPLHKEMDDHYAQKLLEFKGRRIICGGTTGEIVARYLGKEIKTVVRSFEEKVPPIGRLEGVHLLTEGILTMTQATEYMKAAQGDISSLPNDNDGAVLLALELLTADEITFLVGMKVNPFYQNPLLPESISIRKNTVEAMAQFLRELHKDVHIEYC